VYRAVDQHGQVIYVYVAQRGEIASARTFFTSTLAVHGGPTEVITDRAPALANVIEELVPAAWHNTGQSRTTGSSATTNNAGSAETDLLLRSRLPGDDLWVIGREVASVGLPPTFARLRHPSRRALSCAHNEAVSADTLRTSNAKGGPRISPETAFDLHKHL
jgi:hypothetical protein